MIDNYVFTQNKEVVMTAQKTVTTINEKLEECDLFGRKQVIMQTKTVKETLNKQSKDFRRAV